MTPPVVLSIAGSDSSGGAGIQADLRTLAALGVHATTAVTVVTAQDSHHVALAHAVGTDVVAAQIDAVIGDLPVAAVKTGMLGSGAVIEVVAERAAAGRLPNLVVDPVLVDSRGRQIVDDEAIDRYREALFPLATVITPNLDEARLLVGGDDRTVAGMEWAAAELGRLGSTAVVVKGGRLAGQRSPDIVWSAGVTRRLAAPRVATVNDHGTGCSLAAAVAAGLACGHTVDAAIDEAKAFVGRAIASAVGWRLGTGHGPIDHLGWSS